jgi:hypothetical protein
MNLSKPTLLGRLIPSLFSILFFSGCTHVATTDELPIIGTYEEVLITSECGEIVLLAKVDTGARTNSIHLPLATQLCLKDTGTIQTVKSASGITKRPIVKITFTIAGETISTTANVADRTHLTYKMLVGVRDLDGRFLVRPERMRDEVEAEED